MKKVLITGSGRRIGKGLVKLFAKDEWDVIIHYNSSENEAFKLKKEIESLGVKSYIFQADLTDENDVKSKFEKVFLDFGVPDVLINNSGVFPNRTKLEDITSELLDDTFAINTKSILFTSNIFSQFAKANSKIINIVSLGALQIWKERIPYNISKAASYQLTKALARELAPRITVNTVNPGFIILEEDNFTDLSKLSLDKIPMGRYGNIDDIYSAVSFFANSSNYITAQYINVDGGYNDCY
jgi:NAD(P)-dependent dehydrogenase (short-subunit alcohol dehydrogenase family)